METVKVNQALDNSGRESYLDWICGLMILQMIAGHLADNSHTNDIFGGLLHILSFYMPWFFFKSGMFFRPTNDLHTTIQKSFKRLMIPFIVWGLIGEAVYMALSLTFHPEYDWKFYARIVKASIIDGKPAGGNGPLWYLFSLFVIKIGYGYLHGKCHDILLLALAIAIPAAMYYSGWNWMYVVSHTLVGFFYFLSGYKLARLQFNKKIVVIALGLFVSLAIFSPSYMIMTANDMSYGNYLLDFIYSLSAIIVINNVVKITPPNLLNIINLNSVGRDSMIYLVVHRPVLITCMYLCPIIGIFNPLCVALTMVVCLTITLSICLIWFRHPKYKWMVGA